MAEENTYPIVKVETFRKRPMEIRFNTQTAKFDGHWNHINTRDHSDFNECIEATKKAVDDWFETTPKTFDELAKAIEESLIWTGYEDCHIDPVNLAVLVNNFLYASPDLREKLIG